MFGQPVWTPRVAASEVADVDASVVPERAEAGDPVGGEEGVFPDELANLRRKAGKLICWQAGGVWLVVRVEVCLRVLRVGRLRGRRG